MKMIMSKMNVSNKTRYLVVTLTADGKIVSVHYSLIDKKTA